MPRGGGIFAAVVSGAALLGLGLPGGSPFLDEGVRHLQGVPETCVAAVGQNVYLELAGENQEKQRRTDVGDTVRSRLIYGGAQ